MSEKPYIRNPKGQRGGPGKFGINEQDIEDFEQEKEIAAWLEREGKLGAVELKHINREGRARNTLLKASISLDQQVSTEDGSRTFADLIAGSDGRDLDSGLDSDGDAEGQKTAADRLNEELDIFFEAIGSTEGTKEWAKKTLLSEESLRNLRSLMKDEEQFEISLISLESPRRLGNFRK